MERDLQQAERRNRQLTRLVELSVTLNSTLDLDALLQLVTATATELLNCAGASILLFEEREQRLYFAASTGSDPRKLAEIPVPIDKSLAGKIFSENRSIILNDAAHDPRHYSQASARVHLQVGSLVGVPMLIKDKVIGVLEAVNKHEGNFTEEDESILSVTATHAAIAINNARLFRDAERRARNLESLRDINDAVLNNLDIRLTLPQILAHVQERLGVDATDVLLLNSSNSLVFAEGRGFRTKEMQQVVLEKGNGHAWRAVLDKNVVSIPNLRSSKPITSRFGLFNGEDFTAYYAAPLIVKGSATGVLEVFHRKELDADHDWLDFFQTLANQTAVAIDSATLFSDLQRTNANLRLAYDATIEGWSHALDLRDRETEGHTQRVTTLTIRLASAYGVGEEDITHIWRGALLHDIGKMGVPDAILRKPSSLTEEERDIMRMHPQYAYDMLAPISYLRPALDIPFCHHEKWDGTGYPRRLAGEEIPIAARLFMVADVWDALRYDRPYRKGWSKEKTLAHIRELSGTHFDPQVVEIFLRIAKNEPGDNVESP